VSIALVAIAFIIEALAFLFAMVTGRFLEENRKEHALVTFILNMILTAIAFTLFYFGVRP
jgi:Na+(H+)/acetate symporter ActP